MRLAAALLALAGAAGTAGTAVADRYEATVGLTLHGGAARLPEVGAATATVPAFGAAVRVTHAWRDPLAWDLQVGGTLTQPATYAGVMRTVSGRPQVGDISRRTVTGAALVGAELRLGYRWIPTVRLGLGPQVRHRSASNLGIFPDAVPAETSVDAVASLSLGLDVRLGAHRLMGVMLQVEHGQPLGDAPACDVVGVSLRLSHAWYPRWWAPDW